MELEFETNYEMKVALKEEILNIHQALEQQADKLLEALEFYKSHADCKTMNIKCACLS